MVKAISKKNEKYFAEYKVRFIENGIKNLNWTREEVENLWKQMKAFAGYAFNLCVSGDMFVKDKISQQFYRISDLEDNFNEIRLDSYCGEKLVEDELMEVFYTGEKEVFEIELTSGIVIKSTLYHKFYCSDGLPHTVKEILEKDLEILFDTNTWRENMQKCKIKSIKSLGKQKTYKLTMKSNQHNYAIYHQNKDKFIISANSHAVAYTYISFMLLILKAHYPLEFYTAILHFKESEDKIKEYKIDAERHNIIVEPLNLNKSKIKFDICDDKIYFGFANIKGIGEGPGERIVAKQSYKDFSDFVSRFGTDESIIKPLIGLRLFIEEKPETLYKYYKWHKDIKDKRESRKKRFEVSSQKLREEKAAILDGDVKLIADVDKRIERCVSGYNAKPTIDDPIPTLKDFLLEQELRDVSSLKKEPEVDEKLIKLLNNTEECEQTFYGFLWNHPVRKSPDYEGNCTFDILKSKNQPIGYVEVMVKEATRQTSKKNKNVSYWTLKVEDVNGEKEVIQIWQDDWDRFGGELVKGALAKIKIKAPDNGFSRYTLWAPKKWPKWEYDKLIPKERKFDLRVVILRREVAI